MIIVLINIMSSISAQRLSLPFQKMTEKWKNGEVFIAYDTKSASVITQVAFSCPWPFNLHCWSNLEKKKEIVKQMPESVDYLKFLGALNYPAS